MKFIYSTFLALIVLISLSTPVLALETGEYAPLAPLPELTNSSLQTKDIVTFQTYIQYVYNLLIALGAVAAVVMITWGGFEYMTSDAVQGKSDGIKKVQNAIYGLLLILSSYIILRTIDPRFVAIPSSLVEPLGLNAPNLLGAKGAIVGQLLKDAEKYASDYAQAKTTVENLQSSIKEKQSAITILEDKLKNYDGDLDSPEAQDISAQIYALEDSINQDAIKATVETKVGSMAAVLKSTAKTDDVQRNDTAFTKAMIEQINARRNEGLAILDQLGANQEQIDLNDSANSAVARLQMYEAVQEYAKKTNTNMTATLAGLSAGFTTAVVTTAVGGGFTGLAVGSSVGSSVYDDVKSVSDASAFNTMLNKITDAAYQSQITNKELKQDLLNTANALIKNTK